MTKNKVLTLIVLFAALLAACSTVATPAITYDPAALRFDGEKAFATETEFVSTFPYRHSGAPNNPLAAQWLFDQFTSYGLTCQMQEWQVVNYSVPVDLQNVVCTLPGESPQQILIVAHHDQSPDTIEGADNDGSGIAILLQLAEIFASEDRPHYTLTFVSTDAEEYGMLGTYHYVSTHPNVDDILAGFSMDNLGHEYYDSMSMEQIGQYRKYGPTWLALTLRETAAAGDLWAVNLRAPLDQILDQAGPISFMDQGPMISHGIPALGMTGHVPPDSAQLHFDLWHRPGDNMKHQSAASLGNAGLVAEAFVRQLLSMDDLASYPRSDGPYLYFDSSGTTLSGAPLYAIFIVFVALFFVGSLHPQKSGRVGVAPLRDKRNSTGWWAEKLESWRAALPHFLALWLPLLAAVVTTYVFVAVGLMDKYDTYPATSKDIHIYEPRWPAIILFFIAMALYFYLARRFFPLRGAAKQSRGNPQSEYRNTRSLAFLVIGLACIYVLFTNPFSLLFVFPTLFWFLIAGRKGAGRALDIVLLLLGGLVFYGLFYFFGFVIYDYNFNFAWFLLMMFSIQMISLWSAVAITAILGAGMSLVVEWPKRG